MMDVGVKTIPLEKSSQPNKLIQIKAFGGRQVQGEYLGDAKDPAILMIPDSGGDHAEWRSVAEALVSSGRHIILLSPSQRAQDGDLQPHVDDIRAVLAQMTSRPILLAAGSGVPVAVKALGKDGAHLAVGLIGVDMVADATLLGQALPPLPSLYVAGGLNPDVMGDSAAFCRAFAGDVASASVVRLDEVNAAELREALLGQLLEFLEQHHPREAREFRSGSDPRTLRDAMGLFATGVTVVTAISETGDAVGMTANSFTSVSLDPPLLLVCIAKKAGSAPHMQSAERFGVNVLQIGQQPASNRFASKVEDRFAGVDWAAGETGVPLLDGSLVSFECERQALYDAGDHFIMIGHVVRAQFEPHRDPLLFFRGKYRRLHFA
jgi:flavin reductase (DIM6/NTAB) family NADH-FMN oxidoreductase RutF